MAYHLILLLVGSCLNSATQVTVLEKKLVYNLKKKIKWTIYGTKHIESPNKQLKTVKNQSKFRFRVFIENIDLLKEDEQICVFMKRRYGALYTILCFIFWIDTTSVLFSSLRMCK